MSKVSIIGAGYVGLVTGVGLASVGYDVTCVEKIQEKIETIRKGQSTIYEKGLDKLLSDTINKKFKITSEIKTAILNTDITIVCVGTYPREDGSIDLSQIQETSKTLGEILKTKNSYHLIVIKSTVVPTTTRKKIIPILEKYSGKKCGEDFGICTNPEFLREGYAVDDFLNPDRIVIGEFDTKSGSVLENLYQNFDTKIIRTSIETAEMIKYVNNSFLGLLISYSNEISNISENIGVDVTSVLEGLYSDRRLSVSSNGKKITPNIVSYIFPGPGFGGSCLPKDISALVKFSEDMKYNPKILKEIIEMNKSRPNHMVAYLEDELGSLKNKTLTVLGLSFKPDTDDIRDSPAIEIIKILSNKGARIKAYDPVAMNNTKKLFPNIIYSKSIEDSLKDSEGCFIVTKWKEFKNMNEKTFKSMKNPIIVDCRRMLNPQDFKNVKYIGVGLGKI